MGQLCSLLLRNESYVGVDRSEQAAMGQKFQILTKSHFIDYVSRATFASQEYPGPMTHYRIICEGYVVDVIATVAPDITRLRHRKAMTRIQ